MNLFLWTRFHCSVVVSFLEQERGLHSVMSLDCRSPGSSVHGLLQARILEWVAISFSRVMSFYGFFCFTNKFF